MMLLVQVDQEQASHLQAQQVFQHRAQTIFKLDQKKYRTPVFRVMILQVLQELLEDQHEQHIVVVLQLQIHLVGQDGDHLQLTQTQLQIQVYGHWITWVQHLLL